MGLVMVGHLRQQRRVVKRQHCEGKGKVEGVRRGEGRGRMRQQGGDREHCRAGFVSSKAGVLAWKAGGGAP